jgi:hypothetical protein
MREIEMTKYELLQHLEWLYPSREDWFVADEDEGIVKICFSVDPDENDDELVLSKYEKGFLTGFYFTDPAIQKDCLNRNEDNDWYGVHVGERVFDLCIWKDEDTQSEVCVVYECFLNDNGEWSTNTSKRWFLKESKDG